MYTGCTNNLKQRLEMHNSGKVFSTHLRQPFRLIFYEVMLNKHDAFLREQWLKTGWGRNHLNKILKNYLKFPAGKHAK